MIIWWITYKGYTMGMWGRDEHKWLAVMHFDMFAACMNPLANCSCLMWFWFQELWQYMLMFWNPGLLFKMSEGFSESILQACHLFLFSEDIMFWYCFKFSDRDPTWIVYLWYMNTLSIWYCNNLKVTVETSPFLADCFHMCMIRLFHSSADEDSTSLGNDAVWFGI